MKITFTNFRISAFQFLIVLPAPSSPQDEPAVAGSQPPLRERYGAFTLLSTLPPSPGYGAAGNSQL